MKGTGIFQSLDMAHFSNHCIEHFLLCMGLTPNVFCNSVFEGVWSHGGMFFECVFLYVPKLFTYEFLLYAIKIKLAPLID